MNRNIFTLQGLLFLTSVFCVSAFAQTTKQDYCSYFPIKNGLKFTYTRKDLMGERTITETYSSVNSKTLKSGKAIKGYKIISSDPNRNNTVIYYYCENGSVKMYSEMPEYNTYIKEYEEDNSILPSDYNKPDYKKTPIWETEKNGSGKYLSFTELKAGNVGSVWKDIQVVNNNTVTISSSIEEIGLTLEVGGQSYSDVMHIKRRVSVVVLNKDHELNTQDIYYAKNIGKIRSIENGNDMLMGTYTSTQELTSHNLQLPVNSQKNSTLSNNKTSDKQNTTTKTAAYKLGEKAVEEICNKWCGSYKLIEKDGKAVSDFPEGEYLHIETEGDGIIMILKKRSGKLYETGKETPFEWSVWMDNGEQIVYLRTQSEVKGKPFDKNSVPRKKISIANKVYEYVSREVQYF